MYNYLVVSNSYCGFFSQYSGLSQLSAAGSVASMAGRVSAGAASTAFTEGNLTRVIVVFMLPL